MTTLLHTAFKFLTLKNKSGRYQEVVLGNGDTVSFHPGEQKRLSTANMGQIPDTFAFRFIEPSMQDLVNAGVITPVTETVDNSAPAAESDGSEQSSLDADSVGDADAVSPSGDAPAPIEPQQPVQDGADALTPSEPLAFPVEENVQFPQEPAIEPPVEEPQVDDAEQAVNDPVDQDDEETLEIKRLLEADQKVEDGQEEVSVETTTETPNTDETDAATTKPTSKKK